MKNDHVLYEKIDLYLKNSLPEEEHQAFSNEIINDASLREIVNTQKIANEIIYTKQLISLQSKIKADLAGNKKWFHLNNLLLIGSLLTASIGAIWFFNTRPMTESSKQTKAYNITYSTQQLQENNAIIPSPYIETNSSSNTKQKEEFQQKVAPDTNKVIEQNNELLLIVSPLPETKTEIIANNTTQEGTVRFDCKLLSIKEAISSQASCEGDQTGKIIIDEAKIQGGKAPFLYSLNNKEKFSFRNEFHYLRIGTYTVYIRDAFKCISEKTIEITEKNCKAGNAFAFTPEQEKWTIPVNPNKEGNIKIFNNSGILVYTSDVNGDKENNWNGFSSEGHLLESGYFTYQIKYSDGEEEAGSISIIRQ